MPCKMVMLMPPFQITGTPSGVPKTDYPRDMTDKVAVKNVLHLIKGREELIKKEAGATRPSPKARRSQLIDRYFSGKRLAIFRLLVSITTVLWSRKEAFFEIKK